jgi:hypothetical protein
MSLETAIQNLADAINALAATRIPTELAVERPRAEEMEAPFIPGTHDPALLTPAESPKRRGRPPKSESTAPAAVVGDDEAKPEAPAPALAAVADVTALRNLLIEVVKKHGREACGSLCRNHGGPNLTALDPAVYPALYADATALLATEAVES